METKHSSPLDVLKGDGPIHLPDLSAKLHSGVPRTLYDDAPVESYMGPIGSERIMINKQGLRLKSYFWPASNPRAVLVFVHGHGAHLQFELLKFTQHGQPGVYTGSWAEAFNAAGISVCGIDNQGCGKSDGLNRLRYYIDDFQDYIDDIQQLVKSMDTVDIPGFSNLPIFLSGISMGGCIAFNAALQDASALTGIVLLAPMLSLEKVSRKGLNPYLRPLSSLLSYLVPTAAIVATDKNIKYPDIQAFWDQDPLTCSTNTRVRNANEYLKITESTMTQLDNADFPFIIFHSENDTMCDCDGSKELYKKAASEDKTLRLVNDMWHVLVKEDGNEKVREDIIQWMLERAS